MISIKSEERRLSERKQRKIIWNQKHQISTDPNFYTTGYSGIEVNDFIALLKDAGVMTLIDIRWAPISRFRPEFSKTNIKKSVEAEGIVYNHRRDWGIPSSIRASNNGKKSREDIWTWYDVNVLPNVTIDSLQKLIQPVAFMCMEYDPEECHRHRIFLSLQRQGLSGCEL